MNTHTLLRTAHRWVSFAALAALLFAGGLARGSDAVPAPVSFDPVPEGVYDGVPFNISRVPVPQIPGRSVSIIDFGAVGDGKFLNTEAFDRAIRHMAEQGGGRVVVPRGIWLTGPIELRDRIQLHTESGALVQFSTDRSLYPLVETSFEGLRTMHCQSPLSAYCAQNIAITGDGVYSTAPASPGDR